MNPSKRKKMYRIDLLEQKAAEPTPAPVQLEPVVEAVAPVVEPVAVVEPEPVVVKKSKKTV